MAHEPIKTLAVAALVLVVTTGVGAAAGAGDDGVQQADYAGDAHSSLHVHASATPDGVVVTADYEGDGEATMTVSGVGGTYDAGGTWTVDGTQTVELSAPDDADGVRIVVEAPDVTVERTIEFRTVQIDCGLISTERAVPAVVTYGWTATADGETHSDSESVELPVEDIECPSVAELGDGEFDASEQLADLNERLEDVREEVRERRSTAFGPDSDDADEENRSDEESESDDGESDDGEDDEGEDDGESVHDAHDAHDEAHETVRDGVRTGNETGHEAYDEAEDRREDGREGAFGMIGAVFDLAQHAAAGGEHAANETERDTEVARQAMMSFVSRVLGDAGGQVDPITEEIDRTRESAENARDRASDRVGNGSDDAPDLPDRTVPDPDVTSNASANVSASANASVVIGSGGSSVDADGDATVDASAESSAESSDGSAGEAGATIGAGTDLGARLG